MEAIRISCAGFPTRKTFDEFVIRFGILAPDSLNRSCEEVDACKRILERANLNGYQIGKTKVFLRAGQMAELDAHRNKFLGKSARVIQRKVRSYFARKIFIVLCIAAMQLQAVCRGEVARHLYLSVRREATCLIIQKDARTFLAKKAYGALCSSAICIQTGIRAISARNEFHLRKQTQAAIFIQSHCRGYLARLHYLRTKKAAIATQCAWRGKIARRELRKLKMLGDFGCATLLDRSLPVEEGDARYMPQEILNEKYDCLDKVEVFSLGGTIYEIVRGYVLPESGPQLAASQRRKTGSSAWSFHAVSESTEALIGYDGP